MLLNFENTCRICAKTKENNLKHIFTEELDTHINRISNFHVSFKFPPDFLQNITHLDFLGHRGRRLTTTHLRVVRR